MLFFYCRVESAKYQKRKRGLVEYIVGSGKPIATADDPELVALLLNYD